MAGVACGRPPEGPRPPRAEFLVTTADSTYWVRADSAGIRLKAAPLTVARVDGRFVEIYVADEDRSFQDAVFVSQRVYARDLLTGDSTVVWRDTVIPPMAMAWGRAHAESVPLGPGDEEDERVHRRATLDVTVVGVHGQWASLRLHHDLEDERQPLRHRTERSVVDLTSGHVGRLADLFGEEQAGIVMIGAERQLAAARDSANRLPPDRRLAARRAVRLLGLTERRFALVVRGGRPGAELMAAANGFTEDDPTLALPVVTASSAPWWTPAERERHPDSTIAMLGRGPVERWRRGGFDLLARSDTGDGPVTLALRDAAQHEFPVVAVSADVAGITWLDRPALDSAERAALMHAFAEAAYYSDEVRTVRAGPAVPRLSLRSVHVRHPAPAPSAGRIAARNVPAHDAERREHPRPRLRRIDSRDDRLGRGDLRHATRPRDVRDRQH